MRTEEEVWCLYKKVIDELEKTPKDEIERFLQWEITTPTERMLEHERINMIKTLFEWVLEIRG
jgi:hypothetical protein